MKLKTFRGGIQPPSSKHLTASSPIESAPIPKIAVIPLAQHTETIMCEAKPLVEVGSRVKEGTKIGEGYVNIHSSVSGIVKSIEPRVHPIGGNVLSVIIESDGNDEIVAIPFKVRLNEMLRKRDGYINPNTLFESLTPSQIVDRVKEAGIVELGGVGLPTYIKLSKNRNVDLVILNGAESEPYLTSDYRLMIERAEEILLGGKLIMKALGAKSGYIGIEENKHLAISKFKSIIRNYGFELCILEPKYPQGDEKHLVYAISGRKVPLDGTPLDVGVYVQNVATAIAIYEACSTGKPLIEKVITVTGDVNEPKNLLVRIGTLFKELIQFCGGYTGKPQKIIMGGPMTGVAQITDEVPVIKTTTGILVQSNPSLPIDDKCIRCGSCVEVCSIGLLPMKIADYVTNSRFDQANELGVLDCIECGSCAWVCPAKRNLVHLFKYGKLKVQQ